MTELKDGLKPETLAAQALGWVDRETRAVTLPVHLSTTFERDPDYKLSGGRAYARDESAAMDQPQALLAALEGGKACALLGSGMAAATAAVMALTPGDHIVAPKVMYWALRHWMMTDGQRWGLKLTLVDQTSSDAIRAAVRPGQTKLIWLETPANPDWGIADIAAAAEIAHRAGARLAVDNTVATPLLTQPLALGADLVMHSATKFLNGHSDVLAGALVAGREDAFWTQILDNRAHLGAMLGGFEAWLLLRGMRTLSVRLKQSCANAEAVAQRFQGDPRLEAVLYPGLKTHPNHAIAARQMRGGFGGMMSIRVKGGAEAALAVAGRLQLWHRATSLGGTESLVEHRATVEGPDSPVAPDLLRLSVGIEAAEDLIADLDQALDLNRR